MGFDQMNEIKNKIEISNERQFREKPFCYQDKDGLRLIRKNTKEKPRTNGILRQIYLTLTEIASDCGKNTFSAAWKKISSYCGLSTRTLNSHAPMLVDFGLIKIKRVKRGKLNSPNVFTLLSTPNEQKEEIFYEKEPINWQKNKGHARPAVPSCTPCPHIEDNIYRRYITPPEELTPAKQEKTPFQVKNTKSNNVSKKPQKNEWFIIPKIIAYKFSDPNNLEFLNQSDKMIIIGLPEYIKNDEKRENLEYDIEQIFKSAKEENINEDLIKKLKNISYIIDKFNLIQYQKGCEIIYERDIIKLSYLRKTLLKAFMPQVYKKDY